MRPELYPSLLGRVISTGPSVEPLSSNEYCADQDCPSKEAKYNPLSSFPPFQTIYRLKKLPVKLLYPATANDGVAVDPFHEYKRRGTCNIFVAVAPKAGVRIVKVTDTRTKEDFAYFVEDLVEKHFSKAKYLQLVLDNLNTHFEGSLIETFGKRKASRLQKKIKFIYTPKHASWLNMAEIEINIMDRMHRWQN